jgi:hypothetical protein
MAGRGVAGLLAARGCQAAVCVVVCLCYMPHVFVVVLVASALSCLVAPSFSQALARWQVCFAALLSLTPELLAQAPYPDHQQVLPILGRCCLQGPLLI